MTYRAATLALRKASVAIPTALMLLTSNGDWAVVDPQAVVAVWHANGKDWVALAAHAVIQVASPEATVTDWLALRNAELSFPSECKVKEKGK